MKRATAQLLRSGYLGCAFLLGLTVLVWQFPGWLAAHSGAEVHTHARVDCLAWSADGALLASGSRAPTQGRVAVGAPADALNRVDVWDPQTGTLRTSLNGHRGPVAGVTFTSDGRRVVAASRQEIRTWDLAGVRRPQQVRWPKLAHAFLAFSPDGSRAATSDPGSVSIWDVASGAKRTLETVRNDEIRAAAFSGDGRLLAAAGKMLSVWDAATDALRESLGRPGEHAASVALSNDGALLASGEEDGSVDLWDVETGVLLHVLLGHTATVRAIAFSPDGKLLATGSREQIGGHTWGEIRLWETATGALRRRLSGHTDTVSALAFSPRGTWLASGSFDTTVRLWKVG